MLNDKGRRTHKNPCPMLIIGWMGEAVAASLTILLIRWSEGIIGRRESSKDAPDILLLTCDSICWAKSIVLIRHGYHGSL